MTQASSPTIESVLNEGRCFEPPADLAATARFGSMAAYRDLVARVEVDPDVFWGELAREHLLILLACRSRHTKGFRVRSGMARRARRIFALKYSPCSPEKCAESTFTLSNALLRTMMSCPLSF
jgi:hypothetical protein